MEIHHKSRREKEGTSARGRCSRRDKGERNGSAILVLILVLMEDALGGCSQYDYE